MARLRNRNRSVPCGWVYLQPQTGKQFKSHGFDDLIGEVIKHRLANPQHKMAADYGSVSNDVEAHICAVLKTRPQWHRFIGVGNPSAPAASPKPWSPQSFLRNAGSAVGVAKTHIRNTVAGIGLYIEWFGSGGSPVEKEEAERRASICVGCPKITSGDYYQRWGRGAAYEIMTVLSIVKDLDLSTTRDAELDAKGICNACDCPMKAKIWSPLAVIKRHMRKESEAELWEECWIPAKPKTGPQSQENPAVNDSSNPSPPRRHKPSSPIIEVD